MGCKASSFSGAVYLGGPSMKTDMAQEGTVDLEKGNPVERRWG